MRNINGMIIGRDELNYSEKNLLQCHLVYHRAYIDYPGIVTGVCAVRSQ
jgi:hypothetical protein